MISERESRRQIWNFSVDCVIVYFFQWDVHFQVIWGTGIFFHEGFPKKGCLTKWFRSGGVEGPLPVLFQMLLLLLLLRKGSKATETRSKGPVLQNLPPTQTSGVIGWINTKSFSSSLSLLTLLTTFKVVSCFRWMWVVQWIYGVAIVTHLGKINTLAKFVVS